MFKTKMCPAPSEYKWAIMISRHFQTFRDTFFTKLSLN